MAFGKKTILVNIVRYWRKLLVCEKSFKKSLLKKNVQPERKMVEGKYNLAGTFSGHEKSGNEWNALFSSFFFFLKGIRFS